MKAAYKLIAEALRQNSTVLMVNLAGATYDGKPTGDWEVSVRRIDG